MLHKKTYIIVYYHVVFKAKTPEQWEASNKTVAASPACKGGFGK